MSTPRKSSAASSTATKPSLTLALSSRGEASSRVESPLSFEERRQLARELLGAGRKYSPERDAVAELIEERSRED